MNDGVNIAIDIRSLLEPKRTGVGEYTFELLDALFKIDKQNQYFLFLNSSRKGTGILPDWKQDNVTMLKFNFPNRLFNLFLWLFGRPKLDKLILKKIKKQTGRKLKLYYWFAPNLNFLALSKDVKLILTIHDLSFLYFPDCFGWKSRLWHKLINPRQVCQKAELVLAPSANTARDIKSTYGIAMEKIKIIYPGLSSIFNLVEVDEPELRRVAAKYNLSDKIILFLGTIEPRKNIIGVIEGFGLSNLASEGYELIIAGGLGWRSEMIMKSAVKNYKIRYIGYVEAKDKPALYKLAKLFVYPSLYEGFGFPVLEALSVGTPILTSGRSALPEVAGGCARLVNPNNIDNIAKEMRAILTEGRELNLTYKGMGLRQAARFSWEKSASQLLNIINV